MKEKETVTKDITITSNLDGGRSKEKEKNENKFSFRKFMDSMAVDLLSKGSGIINKTQDLGKAIDGSDLAINTKKLIKDALSSLPTDVDKNVIDSLDKVVTESKNMERKFGKDAANALINMSLRIQNKGNIKTPKEWRSYVSKRLKSAIKSINAKYANKFNDNRSNHAEWYNRATGFNELPIPDFSKNMKLPLALGVAPDGDYYIPTVRAYYIGNPLQYGEGNTGTRSTILNDVVTYCYGPVVNALLNYKNYALNIQPINIYYYIYNICAIQATLYHVAKLMNLSNWYDDTDFTVPTAIFEAAQITLPDVVNNYANLKTKFASILGEFRTIPYPHIAAFDRIKFLYYNLFKEENHIKTSYYFQIPAWVSTLYTYEGTAYGDNITEIHDLNVILDNVREWIQFLRTDANFVLLQSAFVNAYGKNAFKPLDIQVRKGDQLYDAKNIIHSEDLEMQLHNGVVITSIYTGIPEHAGVGTYPILKIGSNNTHDDKILRIIDRFNSLSYIDTKSDKPVTRDDTAKLTKFQGFRTTYSSNQESLTYVPMGTECIMGFVDVKLDEYGDYVRVVTTNGASVSTDKVSQVLLDSMRYSSQPPVARMVVDLSDPADELYLPTTVLQDFHKYGVYSTNNNSTMQSMVARSLYQAVIYVPEVRKSFVIK